MDVAGTGKRSLKQERDFWTGMRQFAPHYASTPLKDAAPERIRYLKLKRKLRAYYLYIFTVIIISGSFFGEFELVNSEGQCLLLVLFALLCIRLDVSVLYIVADMLLSGECRGIMQWTMIQAPPLLPQ